MNVKKDLSLSQAQYLKLLEIHKYMNENFTFNNSKMNTIRYMIEMKHKELKEKGLLQSV